MTHNGIIMKKKLDMSQLLFFFFSLNGRGVGCERDCGEKMTDVVGGIRGRCVC